MVNLKSPTTGANLVLVEVEGNGHEQVASLPANKEG